MGSLTEVALLVLIVSNLNAVSWFSVVVLIGVTVSEGRTRVEAKKLLESAIDDVREAIVHPGVVA